MSVAPTCQPQRPKAFCGKATDEQKHRSAALPRDLTAIPKTSGDLDVKHPESLLSLRAAEVAAGRRGRCGRCRPPRPHPSPRGEAPPRAPPPRRLPRPGTPPARRNHRRRARCRSPALARGANAAPASIAWRLQHIRLPRVQLRRPRPLAHPVPWWRTGGELEAAAAAPPPLTSS